MDVTAFIKRARGGRVVETPFLEPEDQAHLQDLAEREGVRLAWFGGLAGAARRMGVLYPEHVPAVSDPTRVLEVTGEGDLEARVRGVLDPALRGEVRATEDGVLVVTTEKGRKQLVEAGLEVREVPRAEQRRARQRVVVVPSLRVDVVGAKGFGTSRNYFVQGVKAGKVRIGGRVARAKDVVTEGDVLVAEGLGQLTVLRVLGRTTRGNVKLEVLLER